MNAVDQGRVNRARERLKSAADDGAINDPAIRILKLNPPEAGAQSIRLNRRLTMLSGLSSSGVRTLFATIDGMGRDANNGRSAAQVDGPDDGTDGAADTAVDEKTATLLDVIDSCEQAILLSGAEMRGADMALADLEDRIRTAQTEAAAASTSNGESNPGFAEFIAQVLANPADAASIESGLADLHNDPRRVALQAACSLDLGNGEGAGGPRLFGSNSSVQTNLVRAEAEGDLSEYDMTPGSPAYVLASRLDHVGIPTSPLDALDVATRLLADIEKAVANQAEFEESLGELTGVDAELVAEREMVIRRRSTAARRHVTQQHLRQIARSQVRDGARGGRRRGLMPILIEEPFADLPDELTHATLAMLLDYTELAQVILVTGRSDVRAWFSSPDDRTECVDATGWFAEEHAGW